MFIPLGKAPRLCKGYCPLIIDKNFLLREFLLPYLSEIIYHPLNFYYHLIHGIQFRLVRRSSDYSLSPALPGHGGSRQDDDEPNIGFPILLRVPSIGVAVVLHPVKRCRTWAGAEEPN